MRRVRLIVFQSTRWRQPVSEVADLPAVCRLQQPPRRQACGDQYPRCGHDALTQFAALSPQKASSTLLGVCEDTHLPLHGETAQHAGVEPWSGAGSTGLNHDRCVFQLFNRLTVIWSSLKRRAPCRGYMWHSALVWRRSVRQAVHCRQICVMYARVKDRYYQHNDDILTLSSLSPWFPTPHKNKPD